MYNLKLNKYCWTIHKESLFPKLVEGRAYQYNTNIMEYLLKTVFKIIKYFRFCGRSVINGTFSQSQCFSDSQHRCYLHECINWQKHLVFRLHYFKFKVDSVVKVSQCMTHLYSWYGTRQACYCDIAIVAQTRLVSFMTVCRSQFKFKQL